jgi:hypothetical protein
MDLNYDNDAAPSARVLPMLKTADQFQAWLTRVSNKCWAQTGKDINLVSDEV